MSLANLIAERVYASAAVSTTVHLKELDYVFRAASMASYRISAAEHTVPR